MFFVFGPLWFVAIVGLIYFVSRRRPAAFRPLPSFWVSYPGTTPPLGLLIQIYDPQEYNIAADTLSHKIYGKAFRNLQRHEHDLIDDLAFATLGVRDWDMSRGPYNAMEMVKLMNDDPKLFPFVFREMKRKARAYR